MEDNPQRWGRYLESRWSERMLFDSAIFRLWKLNLDGFQGATANRCVFQSILFEWGCFRMALTQRERHNINAKRRNAKTKQQLGMSASTAYHRLV